MQQHLRWAFAGRGAVQHLFDDLVLCVSELVTAAVEAGASEIALTLDSRTDLIRLAMLDRSGGTADRIKRAGSGHRTRIIDAVASRWGVETTPGGAEIWAEFTLGIPCSAR